MGARRRIGFSAILPIASALALTGCSTIRLTVANHAGPISAAQWHLYTIVGWVLVFVAGPVLLLTPLIAWHYRLSNRRRAFQPEWNFWWPLEGFIWIPPIGIVIGLAFVLWTYTHKLDPYRPLPSDLKPVEVQAVGFDWKWLFIYPDQHIATVNELAVPVGRPVHITLTSGTVMQSLLMPQLAGQIYAMAGMRTQLNFAASAPGAYLGENTQYNGNGFPFDKFKVLAMEPDGFRRWVANAKARGAPFSDRTLDQLFAKSIAQRPLAFRDVPQQTFARIIARSTGETTQ